LAAIAFGSGIIGGKSALPPEVVRFEIPPPEGVTFVGAPKISPDGRYLAFHATDTSGATEVWIRPMNTLEAHPLQGTVGAGRPFWSPDGRYLAFFAGGKLKKVGVAGGPAQTVCDAGTGADGSWGTDGIILFDGGVTDSIRQVPAGGGVPSAATTIDHSAGETYHAWPHFLPGQRHFFFNASVSEGGEVLKVGSLDSDEIKTLGPVETRVVFSPTGHYLYVRDQTLIAQPLKAGSHELAGDPFPVLEGVGAGAVGLAQFSVSQNGVLVYRTGGLGMSRLLWVDREGRELEQAGEPASYEQPWMSPDGKRIAVEILDPRSSTDDIWLLDPARDIQTRFTFDPAEDWGVAWSPDGQRIVFASSRGEKIGIYEKPASGAGGATLLYESDKPKNIGHVSNDGKLIVFIERRPETGWDILTMDASGDGEPTAFLETEFSEAQPRLSPDGRWMAYTSIESGRWDIYVQEFPGPGGKWHGKELFYVASDRSIMSVEINTERGFEAGMPTRLFTAPISSDIVTRNRYVADPSGERFLLVATQTEEALAPTTVVMNWAAEFDER
jgi:Tol biopolymer transport system component